MPRVFPKEFRENVIRVRRPSNASMAQVAKDFEASASWRFVRRVDPTMPLVRPLSDMSGCAGMT